MYEFSNYLAHHGIQGQKWGKRYGPPYPLSPSAHSSAEKRAKNDNEGKLESWRDKERKKLDKKYDEKIAKRTEALRKLEKRYEEDEANEKRDKKRLKKLQAREDEIHNLKYSKLVEDTAIRNMTLDDVSRERRAIGAHVVRSTLLAVGTAVLPISPVVIVSTRSASDIKAKSRARFLDDKVKQINKDYAQRSNDLAEETGKDVDKRYKELYRSDERVRRINEEHIGDGWEELMRVADETGDKKLRRAMDRMVEADRKNEQERIAATTPYWVDKGEADRSVSDRYSRNRKLRNRFKD